MIICNNYFNTDWMSVSHYILESSFSCGTGSSKICEMRRFSVLHVNTNVLQHYSLASSYPIVLFDAIKIVRYQKPHAVLDCKQIKETA